MRIAPIVVAALFVASCGSDAEPVARSEPAAASTVTEASQPSADASVSSSTPPVSTDREATTSEPPAVDTSPVKSASETPDAVPSGCRRLTDFVDDTDRWFVVNDGVMGGRSNGSVEFVDGVMRFSGSVVTDGGGFTSLRFRTDDGELAGTDRLELRVKGDGRSYGLTLGDSGRFSGRDVSHRASMTLAAPGEWETVSVAYANLDQTIFGRDVDAEPFNANDAEEVGIIIADGVDGEFTLDVEWIDACS